ncbi:MAG: hypothetical protein LDLANPLL_01560 [Turneriella sp.]|nr:hypothetical protein [Turneriella sp.]
MDTIKIKRVYKAADKGDGFRILVDRLWPRGLSKEKAHVGLWFKDVAPTNELRKWFAHDVEKWPEFQKRYKAELSTNKAALAELKTIIKKEKNVTLLFSASDEKHNNAVVLAKILKKTE